MLDSFHAVSPRPLRYLTGTREAPAPDVDCPVRLNLSLHNIDVEAERLWYACPVDEHPALAITPAWALWQALQLEAEAPDWDASYARSLLRAVQLDLEHGELIIPRDLLAWAGIDAGEQAFVVVGNGGSSSSGRLRHGTASRKKTLSTSTSSLVSRSADDLDRGAEIRRVRHIWSYGHPRRPITPYLQRSMRITPDLLHSGVGRCR